MKKIKNLLCITACLLALIALNGCSILAESKPVDPETAQTLEGVAYSLVSQILSQTNDEQFSEYLLNLSPEEYELQFESMGVYVEGDAMLSGVQSYIRGSEQLGNLKEITGTRSEYDSKGTSIIVTVSVLGDKLNSLNAPREAEVEFVFKDNYYKTLTSCATNVILTFGEKMENAGLNTLIGMGTVFSILILLCLIISCFGIFPKVEAAMRNRKSRKSKEVAIDQPIAHIIEKEEMSETDDLELVAVITAAIHAYESAKGVPVSTDDFVVRSIKRRR
ncbi:MAG: OadG family protein [Lachnospiraceae bacterium]|nr:OadG family protein [Lachnospiraceae bacterium]